MDFVQILYLNWRGEKAIRNVVPHRFYFGCNEWHPDKQWIMEALDLEKGVVRDFAMQGIQSWEEMSGWSKEADNTHRGSGL